MGGGAIDFVTFSNGAKTLRLILILNFKKAALRLSVFDVRWSLIYSLSTYEKAFTKFLSVIRSYLRSLPLSSTHPLSRSPPLSLFLSRLINVNFLSYIEEKNQKYFICIIRLFFNVSMTTHNIHLYIKEKHIWQWFTV